MIHLFALAAQATTPFAGVEWRPLSRADLVWVEEQRTSGLAVGEFDGVAAPDLAAFGGVWLGPERVGISGGVGVARLTNITQTDQVVRTRHWGVVRPSLDLRLRLGPIAPARPVLWLIAGLHGDLPSARDVSNGYTPEEQELADEAATAERARLGGVGARAGAGVDLNLTRSLAVGAMYTVEVHQAVLVLDDLDVVSRWLSGQAAVLLIFEWPP